MHGSFDTLRPLIRRVVRHPGGTVLLFAALSIAGGMLAANLRIDTDFSKLLPADHPAVVALERLRETVGGETTAAVIIESPSSDANRALAEALMPDIADLRGDGYTEPYFTRIDYRRDPTFLENNALYFANEDELDRLEDYLLEKIEAARLEANPFYVNLLDEEEQDPSNGTEDTLRDLRDRMIPEEYPISEDGTTLVLRLYVSGAQSDIGFIEDAYADLQGLVDSSAPEAYHPQMQVELGGRLIRQQMEVRAITDDVESSFGAGASAVLLLVVSYFLYKSYSARSGGKLSAQLFLAELPRTLVTALVIGVPLAMSLTWTFGFAYLAFGSLTIMTSTLGLVLFGLGIDYGVHFYARYIEERGAGRPIERSIEVTFTGTGPAVAASALTTALALYVLTVSDFRGFSEFGAIAGTGVLCALVAMLVVLPALVVLLERHGLLNLEAPPGGAADRAAARARIPLAGALVGVIIVAVAASALSLPSLAFEYNFSNLEPAYPEYDRLRDKVYRVYPPTGRNPAYVLVADRAEVPRVIDVLRRRAAGDSTPTIGEVESLQDRFPIDRSAQRTKLSRLAVIRDLLDSRYLRDNRSEDLEDLVRAAQTDQPMSLDAIPEYLKRRFTSKDGQIGNYAMIYPSVGLSDGRMAMQFADDVADIETESGNVYQGTSTSIVAAEILRMTIRESPYTVALTFSAIALVMLAMFGTVRWAGLALLPLVIGLLLTFGVMELAGLKLNFYNLVVLPAVLGIGNDFGVHIVQRYRQLGPGSVIRVVLSTGEHLAIGASTTLIGFAGLLLSFHPGLQSIGQLAAIGIGATMFAGLVFLPALLQWTEDRGGTWSADVK